MIKATWNSDSCASYLQPTFDLRPALRVTLLEDFLAFKGHGTFPDVFGKDVPYTAPAAIASSRVYHVHLLFTRPEKTSSRIAYNRTSDRALVYSQHAKFPQVYSLLAIFPKDAHARAKDPEVLKDIAAYAKAFQELSNP
ncbi:type II toxin-antitoxin system YafO family toxin [Pantoea sp. Morm]|uniref:type II toxin-antitoxin system YafO family toxin n=1 Tax=Pantoea sp. Morm TaxID=2601250 RepID=UPI0031FD8A38